MFIDIGNGEMIQSSEIITMIDYELVPSSGLLQEMVTRAKEEKQLKGSVDEAKSLLVTTEGIYLRTLSVPNLKKRTSIKAALKNIEEFY